MCEHRRPLDRVLNVVDELPPGRIHARLVAHALRDLVVGAGGVAADPPTADDVGTRVQRHAAPEGDDAPPAPPSPPTRAPRGGGGGHVDTARLYQTPTGGGPLGETWSD